MHFIPLEKWDSQIASYLIVFVNDISVEASFVIHQIGGIALNAKAYIV